MIQASEIGQYVYCPRAWWLGSVIGTPSANEPMLSAGIATHRRHAQMVWLSRALVVVAASAAFAALAALIVGLR
jgi:CRISPR/Cas system-associated exonuclease Cas4 (RecB family)